MVRFTMKTPIWEPCKASKLCLVTRVLHPLQLLKSGSSLKKLNVLVCFFLFSETCLLYLLIPRKALTYRSSCCQKFFLLGSACTIAGVSVALVSSSITSSDTCSRKKYHSIVSKMREKTVLSIYKNIVLVKRRIK